MLTRYFPLALFLLLVVAAAVIGARFEAGEWFHVTMIQPSWTPPYWMFPPVLALVHIFMAVAAWRVWLTGHDSRIGALLWWALLLALDVAWLALIFGWNRPGWALPVAGLAVGITLLCMRAFSLLSRQAVFLMAPYLAWVVFILLFNFAAWSLNGGFL